MTAFVSLPAPSSQILSLLHPGYVPGRWYGSPQVRMISQTVSARMGVLRAHPFQVFRDVVVDQLGLRAWNVSNPAQRYKAGIYRANPLEEWPLPGFLVAEGVDDMTAPSTNVGMETSLPSPVLLEPGMYWMATCAEQVSSSNNLTSVVVRSRELNNSMQVWLGSDSIKFAFVGFEVVGGDDFCAGYERTQPLPYVPGESFFPAEFGAGAFIQGSGGPPVVAIRAA